MAHIYVSVNPSGGPKYGSIYERDSADTLHSKIFENKGAMNRRSCILKYRGAIHVVGTFQRPFVRDRFGTWAPSGVLPPRTKPTLADGAQPGSSDGNMIGYQTFVVKNHDIWMAESNPGPASDTLSSGGLGRIWDSLDWVPSDSHVTHARGYVSVDGAFPAMAWERPIGSPGDTVQEAVSTGALGVTLPVRKAPTGQYQVDRYARGVVPYTKYAEVYHDAVFYAGDPDHPERIYYSKLFEPQAVNSVATYVNARLDEPWLATKEGDPVTGLKRQGDELVVGTYRGIDVIQGYTYGDYSIRRLSNYWGVTSHFSMRRCGPLGSLFFSAPQGPTIYNAGTFRFIGEPISTWWRDQYRADQYPFDNAFGVEDRYWGTYNLLLPQTDGSSLWVVVDYNSAEYGKPIWVFDRRDRTDWVSEELAENEQSNFYERYTGSCDGLVRQENVETNADDNGDTYQKAFTTQFPHRYMGDQGGDAAHGWMFHPVDIFLKHEQNVVTASIYAGDDYAPEAALPHWTKALPATQAKAGERTRTAQTSQRESVTNASGKGVTLKLTGTAPLDVQIRGWSIEFMEGPAPKQPFK